ncbi:MAG: F0F1 ATP synthase subunit B [SAR202 cluster bacterium]|mgnify:CR=1 FL=1|nr:F0F1 ATP synthase subunit B [SAR202 cluster bacterium]|tara:strand:+ start:31922 stop:32419 length:498 start_codon:yes stop_codon:yes gene_type:complete
MDALGINIATLLTQIVSFLVLFFILSKVLYSPLVKMLDQRAAKIKESLDLAEKTKNDSEEQTRIIEEKLNEATAEGQAIIAESRKVAQKFRDEELAKVKSDIEAERTKVATNIQREKDAAIEEIRKEFAGLAVAAAERVIGKSVDSKAHKDLIEQVLKEGTEVNQ